MGRAFWSNIVAVDRRYSMPSPDIAARHLIIRENFGQSCVEVIIEEKVDTAAPWVARADLFSKHESYIQAERHAKALWLSYAKAAGIDVETEV